MNEKKEEDFSRKRIFKAQKIAIGSSKKGIGRSSRSKSPEEIKWEGEAMRYLLKKEPKSQSSQSMSSHPEAPASHLSNSIAPREKASKCFSEIGLPLREGFEIDLKNGLCFQAGWSKNGVTNGQESVREPLVEELKKGKRDLEKNNQLLARMNKKLQEQRDMVVEENSRLASELQKMIENEKKPKEKEWRIGDLTVATRSLLSEMEEARALIEKELKKVEKDLEKLKKEKENVIYKLEKAETEREELEKELELVKAENCKLKNQADEVKLRLELGKEEDRVWKGRYVELERRQEANRETILKQGRLEKELISLAEELEKLKQERGALLEGARARRAEKLEWERAQELFDKQKTEWKLEKEDLVGNIHGMEAEAEEWAYQERKVKQLEEIILASGDKVKELERTNQLVVIENERLQEELGVKVKKLEKLEIRHKEMKEKLLGDLKEKQRQLDELREMARQELEKKDREIWELQASLKTGDSLQRTMKASSNWSSQDEISQAFFFQKKIKMLKCKGETKF